MSSSTLKSPLSTYRLQVNADFPFKAVRAVLEYLRDLGVDTLYFSPVFKARPRSPHGYDVTDPSKFSRDAGDESEFAALSKAAAEMGISIILDIVPNHMAAAEDNPWWHDILEHGAATTAADFFDVDWQAPGAHNRIVLPILGQSIEDVVQKGELKLELRDDDVRVVYFQRALPLDPNTYGTIFELARHHTNGRTAEAAMELAGMARNVPTRHDSLGDARAERKRATREFKATLKDKLQNVNGLRDALQAALSECSQPDALRALLDVQAYKLDFWRTGTRQINYRRFFDIADLAGVRIEDRDVFEVTHTLTLELIFGGLIEGVRIDHVDGLRDPLAYLTRLREAVGETYVVVEKILAPGEDLRANWPVQGTTGYDFIGVTAGLFAHPHGLDELTEDYQQRTRLPSFGDIVYEKKKLVIDALFAAELAGLTADVERLSRQLGSPFGAELISAALVELSASLSIYRTYIREEVSPEDRHAIKHALTTARHRAPHIPDALFTMLRRILLMEECPEDARRHCLDFIISWQQFTGPVMAKGLEDTAFYTYHRLISLSEVGSHPDAVTTSVSQFHDTIARRAEHWPLTMNATSTHDTKRSEDVRARVTVLSEMAPEWRSALDRWTAMNARHKRPINGARVPEINEEILIYQTLLGAWPLDQSERSGLSSRLQKFLVKAAREAKNHSSWLDPNEPYEQALFAFVDAILSDSSFLDDFLPIQREVAYYGALNSLSQLIVKLGAPGVPDIYQGTELWNLSLVDPDNRRPVDFELRKTRLAEIAANTTSTRAFVQEMMRSWEDGRIKQYITWTGLQLRKQNGSLLLRGEYIPVLAHGPQADHVIAFARRYESQWALFATSRFYRHLAPAGQLPLAATWNETRLGLPADAPRSWQNIITNEPAEGDSLESYFATLPFGIYVPR
jgi:(1->4)-alpha-D-glucan 1-alpha-D-glucosylmutase